MHTYTYIETTFERLHDGGVRIQWNNAAVDIPFGEWRGIVARMRPEEPAQNPSAKKVPGKKAANAKGRR